jgi:hypothetical protein
MSDGVSQRERRVSSAMICSEIPTWPYDELQNSRRD